MTNREQLHETNMTISDLDLPRPQAQPCRTHLITQYQCGTPLRQYLNPTLYFHFVVPYLSTFYHIKKQKTLEIFLTTCKKKFDNLQSTSSLPRTNGKKSDLLKFDWWIIGCSEREIKN